MATKIKVNMNQKIQPKGKTTGVFESIVATTPVVIDEIEYGRYKAGFKTKEGNKVFTNLVMDTTEGSPFINFLEVIDMHIVPNEQGEAEIDIESAFNKKVGLEIEHTRGKAIVFANVSKIFPLEDEKE